ncbi:MAG: hypothetical protein ACFFDP_01295 [Promethearchaeota archaeon]
MTYLLLVARTLTPLVWSRRIFRRQGRWHIISRHNWQNDPCRALSDSPVLQRIPKTTGTRLTGWIRAWTGHLHIFERLPRNQLIPSKLEHRYNKLFRDLAERPPSQLRQWGYGRLQPIHVGTTKEAPLPTQPSKPFRILKGLPSLTPQEAKLITAALLHDLIDNPQHKSKLGVSIEPLDNRITLLCQHHHDTQAATQNPDLTLLQKADQWTARRNRHTPSIYPHKTSIPVDETERLAKELIQAANAGPHHLYKAIQQSSLLHSIPADSRYTHTNLATHLILTTQRTLYLIRTKKHQNATPGTIRPQRPDKPTGVCNPHPNRLQHGKRARPTIRATATPMEPKTQ